MGKYNPHNADRPDFEDLFNRMTNEQILSRFASVWANMAEHNVIINQLDAEITEARGGYESLDARLDAMTPGGGGTTDYAELDNKPSIAGTTLVGNKTLADLGIAAASDLETKAPASDLTAEETARAAADTKLLAALAERIDTQDKNKMSVNSGTTPSSGSGYFVNNLPLVLPAGKYHVTFKRDTAGQATFVIKDSENNELARWSRASGITTVSEDVTLNATSAYISIYVGNSVDVSDAMICTDADWQISQAIVPYRPSYQEMYNMILALQSGVNANMRTLRSIPYDPEPEEVQDDASR
ncbi:MAG: hypothetical protein IJL32_05460 [Oscillospiraceae bacterium]|nr:hypothetical protein [Oscillospiraceae bacterium]